MRHNTLRIYMVVVGLLIVVCSHAQMSLEDKSASSGTEPKTEASAAWSDLMPLEVIPDNGQYTDMKVQLTMKQVKAFVKNLRKIRNKAITWEETAKRENVKNMEKCLNNGAYGSLARTCFCDYASFNIDGMRLTKRYYSHDMSGLYLMAPMFNVDANGDCYVTYEGNDMGAFSVSTGKTYESTTTVGTSGLFGVMPRATGHSTSQELMTYKPGKFSIKIPISGIDAYIGMLEEGLRHFDAKKAEKKMFK